MQSKDVHSGPGSNAEAELKSLIDILRITLRLCLSTVLSRQLNHRHDSNAYMTWCLERSYQPVCTLENFLTTPALLCQKLSSSIVTIWCLLEGDLREPLQVCFM